MKHILVTATPPTTNGDLHVGHLSGPYLAADVFVRYQRMQGNRPVYFCSGDDHQSYVSTTARRRGESPQQLVRTCSDMVKATLQAAHIELDLFTNALENPAHGAFVQGVFQELYDQGVFTTKTTDILYCATCHQYLVESFAKGRCPFCDEDASGNLCEACGHVNNPTELRDARCSLCNGQPEVQQYTGLFLPLEEYRSRLAAFYATRTSWRPHLRALCQMLVAHPFPDYPVSYPIGWGLPVPVAGFEGQVINVWWEMFLGHVATTQAWALQQGDAQIADVLWSDGSMLVQFLGYDNSFFNAVLHVATSMALKGRYILPEHIITNEFYLLDGQKFSTSRNHAVWGRDILQTVQADALRYYLCRTNPEHMQTNFTYQEFAALVQSELLGLWTPTINGFFDQLQAHAGGVVPSEVRLDLQVLGLAGWARQSLQRCYAPESFSLREASVVLRDFVEGCADYLNRCVVPSTSMQQAEQRRRLASLAYLMRGLALFSAPLMPSFAQQLWMALGMSGALPDQPWDRLDAAAPTTRLGGAQVWFHSPTQV